MALTIRPPRRRVARPEAATPPSVRHGLRASAQRYNLRDKKAVKQAVVPTRQWQTDAWAVWDDVPELKQWGWFSGNVMSKCRLFVGWRNPDDPEADPIPVTDPAALVDPGLARRATDELARLRAPMGGQAEILRSLNMNLEIAGDCHLVGRGPRTVKVKDPATGEPVRDANGVETGEVEQIDEEWSVFSTKQVSEKDGRFTIKVDLDGKDTFTVDAERDEIVRIFQRHPAWTLEADCNMRGVLSTCEMLILLENSIKATAKSQASAGWLLVPNQLTTGADRDTDPDEGEEGEQDQTMEDIYHGLIDPIEDPSSAAAVAPVGIRGEAEALKEFRHVQPGRVGDPDVLRKIEAGVMRLARGANLPVEVIMGHQATTYANAAQVKRDVFDDHFQPRCVLICDALTVGFLYPILLDAGYAPEVAEQVFVWFDPTAMLAQPDPADAAQEAFDAKAIGGEAYRRYKGFSEDDAPKPGEFPDPIASPFAPPELVPPAEQEPIAASAARAREQSIGYQLMLIDRELRAKLAVAADRSLTRALEKAGNRLRAKAGQTRALAKAGFTHPVYVAATLGRQLVASSGFSDDELIAADSWDGLEQHFRVWTAAAQGRALDLLARAVLLSDGKRASLAERQALALDTAWEWLRAELFMLAAQRLYSPDPSAADSGEVDTTARVPAGLIRQAVARAGGASGLSRVVPAKPALRAARPRSAQFPSGEALGSNVYVAVNNGEPAGGIGTGELVLEALDGGGALIEAYEWVYGPAFRAHPFEDHEALDAVVFRDFDADVLAAGDWIGDFYFPGDHDGCNCDFAPVVVAAEDLEE